MSVPAFKDIAKQSNDVLNRDFYHLSPLSLDLSTKAPNGARFNVQGHSAPNSTKLSGKLEGSYTDKASGVTLTQGWLTSDALNTRIDVRNAFAQNLNITLDSTLNAGARSGKATATYVRPNFNTSVVGDVTKRTVTGNVVYGNRGFFSGVEIGYDLRKMQIERKTVQVGYSNPTVSVSVNNVNDFSVFSAGVYNRVSRATEFGARSTVDFRDKSGYTVGLEAAIKHVLDPSAFVKAKLNNNGVGCLSYSQTLQPGITLGVGLETNILQMNSSAHRVGLSLKFAA